MIEISIIIALFVFVVCMGYFLIKSYSTSEIEEPHKYYLYTNGLGVSMLLFIVTLGILIFKNFK